MEGPRTVGEDPVLRTVVAALKDVPGVRAMSLGGSRGMGYASPTSDYDVMVFEQADGDIDQPSLRKVVKGFGGFWRESQKRPGQAVLPEFSINGRHVELFFRNFDRLEAEIASAKLGQCRRLFNPLNTLGFLSTVTISYSFYSKIAWDPKGELAAILKTADPYPEQLRRTMVGSFLWEAKLAMNHAGKIRSVRDLAYAMGLYSHAVGSWNLVLFAVNGRYPVIDKGGRHLVTSFPLIPKEYEFRTKAILRAAAAGELKAANDHSQMLHNEIAKLAVDVGCGEGSIKPEQRIGSTDSVLLAPRNASAGAAQRPRAPVEGSPAA